MFQLIRFDFVFTEMSTSPSSSEDERPARKSRSSAIDVLNQPIKTHGDEAVYGPVLPANIKLSVPKPSSDEESHIICGPALPKELKTTYEPTIPPKEESLPPVCGPALPPHLLKKTDEKVIGPTLPPGFQLSTAIDEGPQSAEDDDEEDEMIGPLPDGVASNSRTQYELEERALKLKMAQLQGHTMNEDQTKQREEWMLELPDVKSVKTLGLGARQFRKRAGPDLSDRSSWTDTPSDKLKAAQEGPTTKQLEAVRIAEAEKYRNAKRDEEQEKLIKKHKKKHKRDKSLLEIHEEEQKRKREEEAGKNEAKVRRPFSRDVDLQANRFDQAQKKSVVDKAKLLDSRFGSGSSKYL